METSVKLANMEKHFNDILKLLDNSQSIKRYLKYAGDNPLKVSATQPDITYSLIGDNIQLSFFDEAIQDGEKIFLFFNLLNSDLSKDTIGEEIYIFDIVIPNKYWRLKDIEQFRAIRIGMCLCEMLDQQAELTGLGTTLMKKAHCFKLNNSYSCMEMSMTVNTSNAKKLR